MSMRKTMKKIQILIINYIVFEFPLVCLNLEQFESSLGTGGQPRAGFRQSSQPGNADKPRAEYCRQRVLSTPSVMIPFGTDAIVVPSRQITQVSIRHRVLHGCEMVAINISA